MMTTTKQKPTPNTRVKPINSRAKGAGGEREFSRLIHQHLGVELVRNLDQSRQGGHDLIAPGDDPVSLALDAYAIEVKRYAAISPAMISGFWEQAMEQAKRVSKVPALAYRADRQEWAIVVPLHNLNSDVFQPWPGIEWTCAMSVPAFACMIRENTKS